MKKIIHILLCTLLWVHTMPAIVANEQNINNLYDLFKKKYDLSLALNEKNEELKAIEKRLSVGDIVGTILLTSIAAGPALTINYLNKYITPIHYQPFIDKASKGLIGIIALPGAHSLTKKTIQSTYNIFTYKKNKELIAQSLQTINQNIDDTQKAIQQEIQDMTQQDPNILTPQELNPQDDKTYAELIAYFTYKDLIDHKGVRNIIGAIDNKIPTNIDNFKQRLLTDKDNLMKILNTKKRSLICKLARHYLNQYTPQSYPSSNNIANDIVAAILLFPIRVIGAAINQASQIEKNTLEELETIDTAIEQLEKF